MLLTTPRDTAPPTKETLVDSVGGRTGRHTANDESWGGRDIMGFHRRFCLMGLAGMVVTGLGMLDGPMASGHEILETFIQHRTKIIVGATNIDIETELTFYKTPSILERQRMDVDHNGKITKAEIEDYVKSLGRLREEGVRLSVGGRAVKVAPLYEPELDLLGVDQVVESHHVLRLFYFGRTPKWLATGSVIKLEDTWWPEAEAILSIDAVGREGFQVEAEPNHDPYCPPGVPRVSRVRCLTTPAGAGQDEPLPGSVGSMHVGENMRGAGRWSILMLIAGATGILTLYLQCRHRELELP